MNFFLLMFPSPVPFQVSSSFAFVKVMLKSSLVSCLLPCCHMSPSSTHSPSFMPCACSNRSPPFTLAHKSALLSPFFPSHMLLLHPSWPQQHHLHPHTSHDLWLVICGQWVWV